jgi:hypothetical protein
LLDQAGDFCVLSDFAAAAALRLADVGIFGPDPTFFTSIGRGVLTVRPTKGLLLLANAFDACGLSGDGEAVGFCEPEMCTVTTAGLWDRAC